jgi:uncharacterized membrane protein
MTRGSRPTWLSPWDLLPLLVALGIAVSLPYLLRGLPDPLPTHFDRLGRPNGWTPQAAYPWICLGLPTFTWLLLFGTGAAFAGTEQDPDGRKSAAMVPLRGLVTTGLLLLMLAVPFIPRFGFGMFWTLLAGFLAVVLVGIILMVRQLKRALGETLDPRIYHWGLFYVNPDDPAIWVPKRLGLGWTLNFAHGRSWGMLGLLLLPVLLVLLFAFSR